MKVLCKKDYIIDNEKIWKKNKLYSYDEHIGARPYSVFILESNNDPFHYVSGSNFHQHFLEYFYSPDETKNALRTKLIDRMLNEIL